MADSSPGNHVRAGPTLAGAEIAAVDQFDAAAAGSVVCIGDFDVVPEDAAGPALMRADRLLRIGGGIEQESARADGVRFLRREAGSAVYSVGSGMYAFRAP